MTAGLSGGDLKFGRAHIAEKRELVNHGLVRCDIQEYCGASAVLREHDRLTSLLNLLYELRGPRPKLGDGLDVSTRLELRHGKLRSNGVSAESRATAPTATSSCTPFVQTVRGCAA